MNNMDETYRINAVVLKRRPFRENDSRVTVYSLEKGKLELVARGTRSIKSKLAAHIEPLNLIEGMAIRGRRFDYLGSAVSADCFPGIKSDYEKAVIAGRAVSIANRFLKVNEADRQIYKLLVDFLSKTSEEKIEKGEVAELVFYLKLANFLGYKPELANCVSCRRKIVPGGNGFEALLGGVICPECRKGKKVLTISDDCLKILKYWLAEDFSDVFKLRIMPNQLKEVDFVISSFIKNLF